MKKKMKNEIRYLVRYLILYQRRKDDWDYKYDEPRTRDFPTKKAAFEYGVTLFSHKNKNEDGQMVSGIVEVEKQHLITNEDYFEGQRFIHSEWVFEDDCVIIAYDPKELVDIKETAQ